MLGMRWANVSLLYSESTYMFDIDPNNNNNDNT